MSNQFPGGIQSSSGDLVLIPVVFGNNPPDAASDGILYVFNAPTDSLTNTYKNGVAYPNAMEGDAFRYQNLRWEWQFHFGTANITGLTQVHHDSTLTGTGVDADNLLRVAKPSADTGAQVNPLNLVKYSASSGNTSDDVPDSEIGFFNANTLVQSGSITQATFIDVADGNANFGSNPTQPGVGLSSVNTTRFFKDKLVNGGSFKIKLEKQGTSEVVWAEVDHLTQKSGGWRLSGLPDADDNLTSVTWVSDTNVAGVNDVWDVTAGTDDVFVADVVDLLNKLSEYVPLAELQTKESDFVSSYTNDILESGVTDKRYSMCIASTSTGVPVTADLYAPFNLVEDGDRTLVISGTQWKNTDFETQKTITSDDLATNQPIFLNFDTINGWHRTFTPTATPVQVGSGNGSYWYVYGTVATFGTVAAHNDNTIQVRDRKPSTFWDDKEIPVRVIVGEDFVLTDGSNVTIALKNAIQGANEDENLAGDFERVASGLASTGDNRYSVSLLQDDTYSITFSVANDINNESSNDFKLNEAIKLLAWVNIGDHWEGSIEALNARYLSNNRAQYLVTVRTISGTIPAIGQTDAVEIVGEDVHRGQLGTWAFKKESGGVQQAFSSSSYESYSSETFNADDLINICVSTTETGFGQVACVRFGDIPTAGVAIATNFDARRNGTNFEVRRTSGSGILYIRIQKTSRVET